MCVPPAPSVATSRTALRPSNALPSLLPLLLLHSFLIFGSFIPLPSLMPAVLRILGLDPPPQHFVFFFFFFFSHCAPVNL